MRKVFALIESKRQATQKVTLSYFRETCIDINNCNNKIISLGTLLGGYFYFAVDRVYYSEDTYFSVVSKGFFLKEKLSEMELKYLSFVSAEQEALRRGEPIQFSVAPLNKKISDRLFYFKCEYIYDKAFKEIIKQLTDIHKDPFVITHTDFLNPQNMHKYFNLKGYKILNIETSSAHNLEYDITFTKYSNEDHNEKQIELESQDNIFSNLNDKVGKKILSLDKLIKDTLEIDSNISKYYNNFIKRAKEMYIDDDLKLNKLYNKINSSNYQLFINMFTDASKSFKPQNKKLYDNEIKESANELISMIELKVKEIFSIETLELEEKENIKNDFKVLKEVFKKVIKK